MREENLLVSCGIHVAQTRVLPLAVVPLFIKILTGLGVRRPVVLPDEFMFQRREEALRHGIVPAVSRPTHAGDNLCGVQHGVGNGARRHKVHLSRVRRGVPDLRSHQAKLTPSGDVPVSNAALRGGAACQLHDAWGAQDPSAMGREALALHAPL